MISDPEIGTKNLGIGAGIRSLDAGTLDRVAASPKN
jgi:hypothetical protein